MQKGFWKKISFGILFLSTTFFSTPSFAYVRTMTEAGVPLFWSSPNLGISINPTNSSGLNSATITQVINAAFQSWVNTGANIGFASNTSLSNPRASNYDGINSIYFTSGSGKTLDWGVIASTEVLYYVSSGQVVEFDMAFNDSDFLFTNTVGDTGLAGPGGKTKIYLQDVATHETGHAYGLDHSIVGNSSLIYTAFSGQFNLGADDQTAINSIYPSAGGKGSINGTVKGTNGGIFGTHLVAINLSTGVVQAGTLANPDGTFRIGDLPVGNYVVMMEPFSTGVSSLSSYWNNINHRFCNGSNFRRNFYSSCGGNGVATTVAVNAGSSTSIGTLSPKCSNMGNPGIVPNSIANAKAITSTGAAMFGTMNTGDVHYYALNNVSGNISAYVASYSLYSPNDVKVEILNSNGSALAGASSTDNVANPMPGGYINYDSSAQVNNLAQGNYLIRITSANSRVSASNFPAGFDLADSSGHYLLIAKVNGQTGTPTTTDMSACTTVNNTLQSANITSSGSGSSTSLGVGGCGSLHGGNGGDGTGNFLSSSVFFILMTALSSKFAVRLAGSRRKR